MKVAELAALTGTTVRTVRHYHAEGLLPVPEERGGWRDYDLSHVARLSRIRWLTEAGLSLAAVKDLLGSGEVSPHEDLTEVLEAVEARIAELEAQRARLHQLLVRVESDPAGGAGAVLTPMPDVVARFYALLEERSPDDATRRAVRRERDFAELAYYRGEMPAVAELLYDIADEEALDRSLAAFTDLGRRAPDVSEDEVQRRADEIVDRMVARLEETAGDLASTVMAQSVTQLYDVFAHVMGGVDARVAHAVRDRLVAHIEERKDS